jgi:FG-GAP repeat
MKTHLSILALLTASLISAHSATDLSETKLMGRWPATLNPTNYYLGQAVALSEKWALVGTTSADDIGGISNDGAVQVFNAVTGVWVRLLRPPAPVATNQYFGYALAIQGDLAVISAYGHSANRGAVFIYNLGTGALVRTLLAPDGVAGDYFGVSLAVSAGKLLVGASGDDSSQGSAYLFDLTTGGLQKKFKGSSTIAGDYFGTGVAMEGSLAVISAPDHLAARGAAYVFDLTTFAELSVIVPAASASNDLVGEYLAMSQGIVVMSSSAYNNHTGAIFTHDLRSHVEHTLVGSGTGAGDYMSYYGVAVGEGMILSSSRYFSDSTGIAFLFDLQSGTELRAIMPSDASKQRAFGSAVALWGNAALIGCSNDSLPLHPNIGSAYLMKPLMTTLPLIKVSGRADFAPGVPETNFSVFSDAFINSDGETAFTAKLTGAASHGGSDVGLWTSLYAPGTLTLSGVTSRVGVDAGLISSLGTPVMNHGDLALFPITFKAGVAGFAVGNQFIFGVSSTSDLIVVGTNASFPPSSLMASIRETVQSHTQADKLFAVSCTLKLDANTTASSDTGFQSFNVGKATESRREGQQVQPSNTVTPITYGQFSGRLTYLRNSMTYTAAIAGPVASNAVLMQKAYGVAETLVAQKGQPGPGTSDLFSAFISETTSPSEDVVYRATFTGPVATNEGLCRTSNGSIIPLRKGTPSPLLPAGLKVAKFINFWEVVNTNLIALVQLAGPGVTSANDMALVMMQENGSGNVLLREGQAAPGCAPATIGVISRVEVDPWQGTYAIIATLAGAPVGTELALFTGDAFYVGNATKQGALRRPVLFLRKGQLYDNQPSKIKSFSLPTTNLTVGGAGGTGRGRAISWNRNFVITIEFDNKVRQIMKGNLWAEGAAPWTAAACCRFLKASLLACRPMDNLQNAKAPPQR